ncbi:MAG: ATPase [Bacteroides sp.]|nr:ATPase [Bacteroides sp.]
MRLIADSGSTKTDWCMGDTHPMIHTRGINPFHQSAEDIRRTLAEELLPRLPKEWSPSHIHFYGAGCTPEKSVIVKEVLRTLFPQASVEVESDLLGAARALCRKEEGIACILGTGSNSCLYDGEKIIANVSPLGYILGDEGSGATLGKRLVGDCLKRQLPEDICEAFLKETGLTPAEIIDKVYRRPQANRFLASLTPFLSAHREAKEIHRLLVSCFEDFFRRNVMQYHRTDLRVHFVGSIARHFREEVEEAATAFGLQTGKFIQSPIGELWNFHER